MLSNQVLVLGGFLQRLQVMCVKCLFSAFFHLFQ